jgi:cysteine desulfuration protein SufE
MTLSEKQRQIAAQLAGCRNVQQRLNWLVDQARARPASPPELRTDAHRVPGCLARLWFVSECQEGHCHFQAESDSLIIKAIAGLLCDFYSGHTPAEILAHDPAFLAEYGIHQHLTPNRRNALSRVWDEIHRFAEERDSIRQSGNQEKCAVAPPVSQP